MRTIGRLLWADCTAGALAGIAMLTLGGWLARVYALPHGLLLVMGAANLLYACYSFTLARRSHPPIPLVTLLVLANAAWAVACLVLAVRFAGPASAWGTAHLVGEAVFVGGLAGLEWRARDGLLATPALEG
jgi:hypothetical protein